MLKRSWPWYGWLGLILIAIFWTLNWSLDGLRTQLTFFPLWLGYCLLIDALVFVRKGSSLLNRNTRLYITLFFLSIPVWWLFELINLRTQNWFYDGRQYFSDLQFALYASLNFSTVIPAVFGSAELVGTFKWLNKIRYGYNLATTNKNLSGFFLSGWLLLILLLIWPYYFYYFMWLALWLIVEPVNYWLGNRSLLSDFKNGDWRPLFALWIGCLICSFFWEMWNYFSYPKWIYNIPPVNFLHIFEMPLLGYLGYLPFSLELYAIFNLVTGLFKEKGKRDYMQIIEG